MALPVWIPFFFASVAISLSPGPGAFAAMGAGLNHGFGRGKWISAGLLLGVLPQFIDAGAALLPRYLTIGATFGMVECVVMGGYVALASRLLGGLRSPRQIRWLNRSFGSLFVMAGATLALFKRGLPG